MDQIPRDRGEYGDRDSLLARISHRIHSWKADIGVIEDAEFMLVPNALALPLLPCNEKGG
jgi:hypothetical protein